MPFAQPEPSFERFGDFVGREVIIEAAGPRQVQMTPYGDKPSIRVVMWTVSTDGHLLVPHRDITCWSVPFIDALARGETLGGILRKPRAYALEAFTLPRAQQLEVMYERALKGDPYQQARQGQPLADEEPF